MASSRIIFDAIIIGGGPAGLSAALALSRVRRPTLVISIPGVRRNAIAHEMHTFITRDGAPPSEFLATAEAEIANYGVVKFESGKVVSAKKLRDDDFRVKLQDGSEYSGRKLLIAMGSKDLFPDIEGN